MYMSPLAPQELVEEQPPGLGNIQPNIFNIIYRLLPDNVDRAHLRLCNKHLKGMVDDLVEEVKGCVRRSYTKGSSVASGDESYINSLLSSNWNVKRLTLMPGYGNPGSEADLDAFFAAYERFNTLQHLKLDAFVFLQTASPALKALESNAAAFSRLQELELRLSYDVEQSLHGLDAFYEQLSRTNFVLGVKTLSLQVTLTNYLGNLLTACTAVEVLKLDVIGHGTWLGHIAKVFAEMRSFQHVKELVLNNWNLESVAMIYLGQAEFPALTKLVFEGGNKFGQVSDGIATWKKDATWVPKLKELIFKGIFNYTRITQPFMELCKMQWSELETFVAMATNPPDHYNEFTELIQFEGITAFVNAVDHFPKIHTLDLCGRYNAEALGKLCKFSSLRALTLYGGSSYTKTEDIVALTGRFSALQTLRLRQWPMERDILITWVGSQAGCMPVLEELQATQLKDEELKAAVSVLRGEVVEVREAAR